MKPEFLPIWLVVFLPICGAIIQGLLGKMLLQSLGPKWGKRIMGTIAVLPVAIAFAIALNLTFLLAKETDRLAIIKVFDWIHFQSLSIPFELRVDTLSMTMTLIITGIGSLIHIFATGYMADEKEYTRFFTYLNLFVACMLVLVLGNNLGLLFIGWEGVGVCSYLLIGFWYKDTANSKAANKAFIVNRIGDFGLTLGMFYLVYLIAGNREVLGITDTRWLSYDNILPHAAEFFKQFPTETTIISLLLFVGAMGKSAQFPLYIWLPDAMAGPTPVSALIHAATMVTSGVVLMNRMSPIVSQSALAMSVIAITGAVTALLGAAIAFGQTDIKKVLAFSTVSQLGYMFIGCGVGAFSGGLFHVITHAFFKALLFLGAGSVIYAMAHNQDMRNYGNLNKWIKITFALMVCGFIGIAGVPYIGAGAFSKESILMAAVNDHATLGVFGSTLTWGALAGWIGFLVAAMTAFYMTRMMLLTFFSGPERWLTIDPVHAHAGHDDHEHEHHHAHTHHGEDKHAFFYTEAEMADIDAKTEHEHHHDLDSHHKPKEVPMVMWLPLIPLALGSLGFLGFWLENNELLHNWLYPVHGEAHEEVAHAISHQMGLIISFVVSLGGIIGAFLVYFKKLPESEGWNFSKWNPIRRGALVQFGVDAVLADGSVRTGDIFGRAMKWFDENIIDGIVRGVGNVAGLLGGLLKQPQTGKVRSYAFLMLMGAAGMIAYIAYIINSRGGGN